MGVSVSEGVDKRPLDLETKQLLLRLVMLHFLARR